MSRRTACSPSTLSANRTTTTTLNVITPTTPPAASIPSLQNVAMRVCGSASRSVRCQSWTCIAKGRDSPHAPRASQPLSGLSAPRALSRVLKLRMQRGNAEGQGGADTQGMRGAREETGKGRRKETRVLDAFSGYNELAADQDEDRADSKRSLASPLAVGRFVSATLSYSCSRRLALVDAFLQLAFVDPDGS
ncbi:hypothetical protein C8R45DRAFT_1108048 [Mycena sanguinolenta]|nr:hypothetical protein C8R45DRAFT_1108048 [Mycena sanguinolenta]